MSYLGDDNLKKPFYYSETISVKEVDDEKYIHITGRHKTNKVFIFYYEIVLQCTLHFLS